MTRRRDRHLAAITLTCVALAAAGGVVLHRAAREMDAPVVIVLEPPPVRSLLR